MSVRKKHPFPVVAVLSTLLFVLFLFACNREAPKPEHASTSTFVSMPGPGKKVPIGEDGYLIYGFVEKPKMGSAIMKIQVFNDKGEKDRSVAITADTTMPSMPSMDVEHESFKLSVKGDYLTPVNITMPGDWEMKITVSRDGKIIYRGSHRFDV